MARQQPVGPGLPHPQRRQMSQRSSWRGLVISAIALPVVAFAVVAANVTPGLAFVTALVLGFGELWFVHRRPVPAAAAATVLPARQSLLRRALFPAPEPEPWDPDAELRELMRRDREVPPGA